MNKKPTLKELNNIMRINGGSLNLRGTQINTKNIKRLNNGDYVEGKYLYADNILTHIRYTRKKGKYILYIGKIKGKNVISDGINYAHCDKWKDGISDLNFKSAKDRGSKQYRNLTSDSVIKKMMR